MPEHQGVMAERFQGRRALAGQIPVAVPEFAQDVGVEVVHHLIRGGDIGAVAVAGLIHHQKTAVEGEVQRSGLQCVRGQREVAFRVHGAHPVLIGEAVDHVQVAVKKPLHGRVRDPLPFAGRQLTAIDVVAGELIRSRPGVPGNIHGLVVRQAHGQLLAVDGVLAQQQPVVGVNFQGGDVVLRRVGKVADAALGCGAHKH